jgi:acyl-CoA thioesterase FadM
LLDLSTQLPNIDLLGTYIWSAREAVGKSLNSANFEFSSFSINEGLFTAKAVLNGEVVEVFSTQIDLKTKEDFVLSFANQLKSSGEIKLTPEEDLLSIKKLPHSEALQIDVDIAKGLFIRWPITFKDTGNIGKTIYFSKFAEWQGRAREIALWPLMNEAATMFSSGDAGWVTNSSETRFFKSGRVGDILEVRTSSSLPYGNKNSAVDVFYDWYRIDQTGKEELMAQSQMQITWVRVMGHGLVEVAPFPEKFLDFFNTFGKDQLNKFDTWATSTLGTSLYKARHGISTEPTLAESIFETTLEDSNLVGNVYFSNYSVWQGRARDKFFHKNLPEVFKFQDGAELYCIRSYVKHLREAMPFDQIQVAVRLREVKEKGLCLYFEYFKFTDGKRGEKIAYGEHDLAWAKETRKSVTPIALPETILRTLLKIGADHEQTSKAKAS